MRSSFATSPSILWSTKSLRTPRPPGPQWYVDAAIRFVTNRVRAGAFKLELLDARFAPLPLSRKTHEDLNLPEASWLGCRSAHKMTQFVQDGGEPAFLAIKLGAHSKLVAIDAKRRGKPAKPPKGEKPRSRSKTPARCCPVTGAFKTPSGEQPTTISEFKIDGVVEDVIVRCRPWVLEAEFNGKLKPCVCTCCEVRQEVKGRFLARAIGDAQWIDFTPPIDYAPPPAGSPPDAKPAPGYADHSVFSEDAVGIPTDPGNPMKPGRRNDLQPREPGKQCVPQDYSTPCSYWMMDAPNLDVPTACEVKIDLTFRAAIVDTCNNEIVKAG